MAEQNSNGTVRIFSARACAAPLEGAAELFEEKTDIHVAIDVCSRHCAAPVAKEVNYGFECR
jgi:ABC-type molybdate transport system substrate-binding protein